MDALHSLSNWIDHNRWFFVSILVGGLLCGFLVGCPATTKSVLSPGERVSGLELEREAVQIQAEYDGKLKQLELAQADLDRQIEFRQKIVEVAGSLGTAATTGTVNPAAGVAAIVQILTLAAAGGAIADNRRKDKVIAAK